VREAVDAGADFLVSQVLRPALVDLAREQGVPFVPGALTPKEILDAWETGVPAVKVSPIGPLGGVDYLDQLSGPLLGDALLPGGDLAALAERARRATAAE
jgi:2-dehydro-3-deoxyphosphogluconate aldolase/(4S)-4-hydroxy-2-oxoglutarate aldolase